MLHGASCAVCDKADAGALEYDVLDSPSVWLCGVAYFRVVCRGCRCWLAAGRTVGY